MNTANKTSPINRISALSKTGESIFCDTDLAIIWGITDKNTLYTTIKRYSAKKILERIKSGIYSLSDPRNIPAEVIGAKILHRYCYISMETILRDAGIILQNIQHTTFISSKSKKFTTMGHSFISRRLKDTFLYNDTCIYNKNGVLYATAERAVADMLYFNPFYYFDNDRQIDWKKVKKIQKEIGYPNKP